MVFSGITFLVYFLPLFLFLYHIVPDKFKNGVILLASIYFYSWGGPKFIFVILGTTFLDFFLVNAMHNQKTKAAKKKYLVLSLLLNVGLLFYFKYCNFFIENFNAILSTDIKWLKVALPIGISFYTFESLTYVIDVYRGIHKPLKNFWHYQTYILLFPKLIAGPIVRYHDIADQITDRSKNYTADMKLSGLLLFCIGLAKKTVIANTIGMQADAVFRLPIEQVDTAAAWVGALAYTFQIYFDFSGYSDMAIGLGRIMGFKLPENFNNPYISGSITEFWRRWHITLGTWMKNYLYIPLGGNQVSSGRLYMNLVIVFLLSGLWHGASWNFVLWGAYHGFFLVIERLFLLDVYRRTGKLVSVPLTFIIVVTGWVLFRNEDLGYATGVIQRMYSFDLFDGKFAMNNDFIFSLTLAAIFSFFAISRHTKAIQEKVYSTFFSGGQAMWLTVAGSVALYYISLSYISALDFNPFIYFRF
jgi:alginate O-acetyltransferase complex protein AlgI